MLNHSKACPKPDGDQSPLKQKLPREPDAGARAAARTCSPPSVKNRPLHAHAFARLRPARRHPRPVWPDLSNILSVAGCIEAMRDAGRSRLATRVPKRQKATKFTDLLASYITAHSAEKCRFQQRGHTGCVLQPDWESGQRPPVGQENRHHQ